MEMMSPTRNGGDLKLSLDQSNLKRWMSLDLGGMCFQQVSARANRLD